MPSHLAYASTRQEGTQEAFNIAEQLQLDFWRMLCLRVRCPQEATNILKD